METIICAIITGAVTLVISLITCTTQHSKSMAEVRKDIQYMTEKIDKLEKKQDKHNEFISRLSHLENEVEILKATCPVKHGKE